MDGGRPPSIRWRDGGMPRTVALPGADARQVDVVGGRVRLGRRHPLLAPGALSGSLAQSPYSSEIFFAAGSWFSKAGPSLGP